MGWWLAAAALAAPNPLGWAQVDEATDAAFARGAGSAWRSERDGLEAARRAEPAAQMWLAVQTAPAFDPALSPFDDNTMGAFGFTLGDRRAARIAWWRARMDGVGAEADAERLAFADAVRVAWLEAWIASSFASHLDAHAAELAARVEALGPAVAAGVVSRALADDLEVELGRLRAEAAMYASAADVGAARLSGLLGSERTIDLASLDELEAPAEARNPWRRVVDRLDAHPELRRREAEVAKLRAEARVARANPLSVEIGAIYRPLPDAWGAVGPMVGLHVPLTVSGGPEARALDAEALGASARLTFRREQLAAEAATEARALDLAAARHEALVLTVERPLELRLARVLDALERGAVGSEQWILANRDLHEAFHDRARATADLLIRRARGEALLAALGGDR